jgi:hypothetical protein
MKKIINGKRYDTNTATLIGGATAGCFSSDFRWWDEKLYRTARSGAYFVAGSGGPMSRWSRRVDGNTWTGGDGILPVSADQALQWAEAHLPAEIVEAHFGQAITDA